MDAFTALDPGQWLVLLAALATAGVAAGLIAGLLGVGGGIVVVPVLYQVYTFLDVPEQVRMHVAVGTSLAVIVATGFSSARAHWRRDNVAVPVLWHWGPWIALGVLAGSAVAAVVDGKALTALFAVVALIVALRLAFGAEDRPIRDRLPPAPLSQAIAVLIGVFSALLGIGGGTFSVPTLSVCGTPIKRAVGTAAALGLIIAVPGTIGFAVGGWDVPGRPPLSAGFVHLLSFAAIVPASVLAAPWGARIAHGVRPETLRRAFAVFLLLVSLRMAVGLV